VIDCLDRNVPKKTKVPNHLPQIILNAQQMTSQRSRAFYASVITTIIRQPGVSWVQG